jgi:hypothetical protein
MIQGYSNVRPDKFIGFPRGDNFTSSLVKPNDFGFKVLNTTNNVYEDLSNSYTAKYFDYSDDGNGNIPDGVNKMYVFKVNGGGGGSGGNGGATGVKINSTNIDLGIADFNIPDSGLSVNPTVPGSGGASGTPGAKTFYDIPINNEKYYKINIGNSGNVGGGGSGGGYTSNNEDYRTPPGFPNIGYTQYRLTDAGLGIGGGPGSNTDFYLGNSLINGGNNFPAGSPVLDYGKGGNGGNRGEGRDNNNPASDRAGGAGGPGQKGFCRVYFLY